MSMPRAAFRHSCWNSAVFLAACVTSRVWAADLPVPVLSLDAAPDFHPILPLWGTEARQAGQELPEPFGVSGTAMFMTGYYKVESLRVALGSGAPAATSLLSVTDVKARAQSYMSRIDVWALPFVNVYGLAGYTTGSADTTVTVLPPLSPTGSAANFPIRVRYEGPTYGGGVTLAWGYEKFYAQLDGNYTYSDLDFPSSGVHCFVFDPRVGYRDKIGPFTASFWVGAMYQDVSQTLSGTFNFLPGAATAFDVDIEAADPWNYIIGTQWDYGKHMTFMVECGVGDRRHIMFGAGLRF